MRRTYGDYNQGSFGLGYRRLMDNGLIFGSYEFYDSQQSENDNQYHAGTFGLEVLDVSWDFRLNGTIPGSSKNLISSNLTVSNDNLVIRDVTEAAFLNALNGFEVNNLAGNSEVLANLAVENENHGFRFATIADFANVNSTNQAFSNDVDGFNVGTRQINTTFSTNDSQNNGQDGYQIGGPAVGDGSNTGSNTGSGNGANQTY
ncbi:hypothetical protein [Rubinisphaera brasiliensis]|uniref:hypothetical protein n=1 Tax=Rubinisphaera brasiliensis TaxID=119 RepID=UPI0001E71D16|nr:hypothetical protein [Rubinisphaera brasiliensis]